ncbi:CocE/NonD family hydrolase [Nocardia sp. CNY236]|uniref:CocE/NonD family hydrolase n=1 Tax=Nocardia sp. CNY236 TaxID=1169152 RepID=UPI00048D8B3B|nr:CocE/NonD family hydrolase [Nocardia sp. CNY236]
MKHALRAVVAVVASALLVPFLASGAVAAPPTGPDGGAAGAAWEATHDAPQAYPRIHIQWDVPITMSDGTVLKANVYRPADASGRPAHTPTPTIVNLTPYTKLLANLIDHSQSIPGLSDALIQFFRQTDLTGTPFSGITDLTKSFGGGHLRNFTVDRQLVKSGYTQLVIDVRGTGFSQGIWDILGAREQQDTIEVIEWAARQPWSNGRIGMSGVSYSGINQVQAAEKRPPALQAIFPIVPGSDLVNDVLAPGGALGTGFIPLWLTAVNGLGLIPDVASILSGQFDTTWLADRQRDPFTFMDVLFNAMTTENIEDVDPRARDLLSGDSETRRDWMGDPSRIRIPTFVVGGWHDLFSYSQPIIYNEIPVPPGQKQLLMGNTYHINSGNEYGQPGLPPRLDVLQRAWFDKWLKDIDNGIDRFGPVTLRQQGGGWITTDSFAEPAAEVDTQQTVHRRMYLSAVPSGTANSVYDGSLSADPTGETARLTVAPGLTGLCSNDAAQNTAGVLSVLDVCAKDSRIQELNALTFTSVPVVEPTTISGQVAVRLNTVQDAADGYWVVTVNDVAPDGRSSVLSSGQILASMRAIDEANSTRSASGDYTNPRPFTSLEHRQPTIPGVPTTLDIALPATEAILQPGHRLRVDVYAGNFPKGLPILPMLIDTGLRPEHLQLDPAQPSFVNIPVRGNPGW